MSFSRHAQSCQLPPPFLTQSPANILQATIHNSRCRQRSEMTISRAIVTSVMYAYDIYIHTHG